jgi:hypothetical protein
LIVKVFWNIKINFGNASIVLNLLKYFSISVKVDKNDITFVLKDSLRFLLKSIDKSATVLYKKKIITV